MTVVRDCRVSREAGFRNVRVCRAPPASHRRLSSRDGSRDARSAGSWARSSLFFRAGGSGLRQQVSSSAESAPFRPQDGQAGGSGLRRQVSSSAESAPFRPQDGQAGGSVPNSGRLRRVSKSEVSELSWPGGGSARSKKSVRAARFWPADGSALRKQALTSYLLAASQLPVSCSTKRRRRCARAVCRWFEVLRNFRNVAWPGSSCGRHCFRNGTRSLKNGAPDGSPD